MVTSLSKDHESEFLRLMINTSGGHKALFRWGRFDFSSTVLCWFLSFGPEIHCILALERSLGASVPFY